MAIALTMTGMTAQDDNKLTLEDLIPGGERYVAHIPENIYGLQWCGDVCIKPGIDTLYAIDPADGRTTILATRDDVNRALAGTDGSKMSAFYYSRLRNGDTSQLELMTPGKIITYDTGSKTVTGTALFDPVDAGIDYAGDMQRLAYPISGGLRAIDYSSGSERDFIPGGIMSEGEGIVYGTAVHRNEFGIDKGTFWSPDGSRLAFYRMDESMVTEYPLIDIDHRIAREAPIRYPMAGMTSHRVQVGVYDSATGNTIYLKTADPTDRYFTNVTWSPDSKKIYIQELNRDQNHMQLIRYDAATGEMEGILFEERHPKYVEPQHPLTFVKGDDDKFIYQSQRDGYNHLYLYDTDGRLIRQLTSGQWLVNSIVGFDDDGKYLYYMANKEGPLQRDLYRVNVRNGKSERITRHDGVHSVMLSASGKYVIDSYTAHDVPRVIDIYRTDGRGKTVNLLTSADPYRGEETATVEVGTIKAADGVTDLYYTMTKPSDFDPTKKYPVIIYVYGGPHLQLISDVWRWASSGWYNYMAGKGYIVFCLDNRGSSNRGLEFENCTFRHLGIEECRDQMQGVEFLKSLPYIDTGRIGVHGWSFGGHMTTALMLRHPDTFKAGVAGGPVIDWALYEVMYGERYMDTPQDNPEGYDETNLNKLADRLKGKLLIIHDYNDKTCVPQHTLGFIKSCVDSRTYPDLFIYPGHDHNVIGRDRVHLYKKISDYFIENL